MTYLRSILHKLPLAVFLFQTGCALQTPLDSSAKDAIRENLEAAKDDSVAEHKAYQQKYEEQQQALLSALQEESENSLDMRLSTSRDKFNVDVKEVLANKFFQGLVAGTDVNIIVHPDVQGLITLSLRNVTLDEVLEAVSSIYDYNIEKQTYGYKVYPVTLKTEVYNLNYLNVTRKGLSTFSVNSGEISSNVSGSSSSGNSGGSSSTTKSSQVDTESVTDFWVDAKDILVSIVGSADGRSVVTNPISGTVVITASPKQHRIVRQFLMQAEANLKRQVIIEAKILEVELNESFQAGINWTALSSFNNGNTVATGLFTDNYLLNAAAGVNAPNLAYNAGQLSSSNTIDGIFTSALTFGDFTGMIELLKTQGEVHVLSSPRISTVNNQKAVIKVGEDEFFVTEFTNNQTVTTDQVVSSPEVTLTPFFSGIALDVTPQIGNSDEIILHIHPSVTQVNDLNKRILVQDQEIDLPLALSRIRESDSIVKARNNQIIVIGGLLKSQTEDLNSDTPWFSDIPVLKALFSQKRQTSRKSELVILLRPIVPEQSGWSGQLPSEESYLPNLGNPTPASVRFR